MAENNEVSIVKLEKDGYGQLELNQVAFRRDGRIEAQLPLDATDFASMKAENGMLLQVNKAKKCIELPDASTVLPIAINFSSEHMYDERANALKDFALDRKGVYPRMGFLSVGDRFTTNTVSYSDGDFADLDALKTAVAACGTTPIYGGIDSTNGYILLDTTVPSYGPALQVVKGTTMPDGQYALKFVVIKA